MHIWQQNDSRIIDEFRLQSFVQTPPTLLAALEKEWL